MHTSVKPTLLITGGGGFLGHPLCLLAREKWSVTALFRQNKPRVNGIHTTRLDLTDNDALADLFSRRHPEAVIHAAANANVTDCEAHPQRTEEINVRVPERLAKICAQKQIPFLFTSTDLVFDGLDAPYDEKCSPNPIGIYGRQKLRAELRVLRNYPRALVCRLPLMFGLAPYSGSNFSVQMVSAIAENRAINLFVDEYRTPVDTFSAARGILQMLVRTHGVLHLGGRTRLSRHELGLMMAGAMKRSPDMIRPVRIEAAGLKFKRAPDCSLDSRKAYVLGYDPEPVEATVKRMVKAAGLKGWG